MKTVERGRTLSPIRLLEMLEWRFGAFEAIASAALALADTEPEMCPPMDPGTAAAILEFGDDLEQAREAIRAWMEERDHGAASPHPGSKRGRQRRVAP